MSRKGNSVEITTYVSRDDHDTIRELARKKKTSISDYLRTLIAQDAERHNEHIQSLKHGGRREKAS